MKACTLFELEQIEKNGLEVLRVVTTNTIF
jgi:hypothetical protein